jgi:ABC-type antimicrobial peptide transport system permease subunit
MTLAGWTPGAGTVRTPNSAGVRVDTMYVTASYFQVLGITLARGPGFTPADENAQPEVIVAHRLWRNRLGADPGIIRSTIVVNGISHVVVGVTPERFRGHLAQHRPGFELFLPIAEHPHLALWERETSWSSIGAVESLVYVAAVAIALGVALLASLPAARRAAAVQPIIAMHAE